MELPKVRPEIAAFSVYATRPAPGAIRLAGNEWPEPTAAGEYLTQDELDKLMMNRYPAAPAELRGLLGKQHGVKPEQVILGNGSIELLLLLLLTFGGGGRKTLLFQPSYAMHARLTTMAGGTPVDEMVGLPYRVTREQALSAMDRVRPEVVFLCTPNNPTGTTIEDDVVTAVSSRYPSTLVIVDEAYGDIAGKTFLPKLQDHPNVVISKTFSKIHGAAGLRLGYLIVHPAMIGPVASLQYGYNTSVLTTALATRLASDESRMKKRIDFVRAERDRVFKALEGTAGLEVFPSEANFILFRIQGDTAKAQSQLIDEGILIRDMTPWTGAEGCLRVTIGTSAENDRFIAALPRVFPATRT